MLEDPAQQIAMHIVESGHQLGDPAQRASQGQQIARGGATRPHPPRQPLHIAHRTQDVAGPLTAFRIIDQLGHGVEALPNRLRIGERS